MEHARLRHAPYSLNIFARASGELSIVPLELVDQTVRLVVHYNANEAVCDVQLG